MKAQTVVPRVNRKPYSLLQGASARICASQDVLINRVERDA